MERSRNFYKTIRLGYILISVLIGCIAYNSFYEWQEIEALELDNKKIVYLANLHTSFLCNLIYPTFSRILLYSC